MILDILEIDYSVSPGGVNSFEVYNDPDGVPLLQTENLTEAVTYCYDLGYDFTVHTLAQYYREFE